MTVPADAAGMDAAPAPEIARMQRARRLFPRIRRMDSASIRDEGETLPFSADQDSSKPGFARRRGAATRRKRYTTARNTHRPEHQSIDDMLQEGQEVLVQVAKEPIAKKGARVTSHIALPGPLPCVHADGGPHRRLPQNRFGCRTGPVEGNHSETPGPLSRRRDCPNCRGRAQRTGSGQRPHFPGPGLGRYAVPRGEGFRACPHSCGNEPRPAAAPGSVLV